MKTFLQYIREEKKLKIVSDVDGVILDFTTPYQDYIRKNFPEIKMDDSKYESGVPKELEGKVINGFFNTNKLANLKFYPGAKTALNNIAKKYDLDIATAIRNDLASNRISNLSGVNYNHIYTKAIGKMDFVVGTLKPDIAIEDKPKNIKILSGAGIKVYYPAWLPYTAGLESYGTPFSSWAELEKILLSGGVE